MKFNKEFMLKKLLPALGYATASVALVAVPELALAKSLTDLASHGGDQFQAAAEILTTGAYLMGAGMGVKAALTFRDHTENPQQVKLAKPITYALVSGLLLGLPTWLTVGRDTTLGSGADQNGTSGGITWKTLK